MTKILDGRKIAADINDFLKGEAKKGMVPKLHVVLVGDDKSSHLYVRLKEKACKDIGFNFEKTLLPEDTTQEELLKLIGKLNHDDSVHGILVQFPLPKQINPEKIIRKISPDKDVDGFTPKNMGLCYIKDERFGSCTAKAIIKLIEEYKIPVKSKDVVIINHSYVIGKPLCIMFLNRDATVSVCHENSLNIKDYISNADIIVTAVGKPNFITSDMVKDGAIVIDAGISKVDGKVVGDVDFEGVKEKSSYITPVPGGVGPMTVSMVMENLYNLYKKTRN